MYGFSLLPVIVGIFALIAGSGLIASDEESGRLDLILAHPPSRTALFWGRLLAFVGATLLSEWIHHGRDTSRACSLVASDV